MQLKALPTRTKAGTDDNGNSTDPADWQAGLLGIATEFAKVAADNLKTQETRQAEQSQAAAKFNWKPWAIGGGAIVGGLILLKVLKVF
jgi:hypothetical protein